MLPNYNISHQTNLIRGFKLCCLITINTYCWVCHQKFMGVSSRVSPSPQVWHQSDWWHKHRDFCMNLFKLLVSTSLPLHPQQEVSLLLVGHFCIALKVTVKGRWLCSDMTRRSACSIDLFTHSWWKLKSASSHGQMNNKWLFTSFFSSDYWKSIHSCNTTLFHAF